MAARAANEQRAPPHHLAGGHAWRRRFVGASGSARLSFGQSQLSKSAGNVNSANASALPYYNENPPQKSIFGAPSLFQVGAQRITDCSTYVPTGDKMKDQECAAVNFLAKNPQNRVRMSVGANDPAVLAAHAAMNGATESLADPGSCVTSTTTTPAEYAIETCSEYLQANQNMCTVGRIVEVTSQSRFQCAVTCEGTQTLQCTRGFGASVQNASQPKSLGLSAGLEIPADQLQTYTAQLTISGTPSGFTLNTYQADNYGQLWVNGVKVWENRLANQVWPDMRHGYIAWANVPATCANPDTGSLYDCSYTERHLFSAAGADYGPYWDDGCNPGCKGQAPNLDITPYMTTGTNVVDMVCMNANAIGPCKYDIAGTDNVPTVFGTYVDDQCATLEARTR
jgi:hypothetical protein